MLTEEQKWRLERGLSLLECGYYSCKSCPNHTDEQNLWTGHCWIEEGSFCPVEYSDWRDTAEFEARVSRIMALYLGAPPCGTGKCNNPGFLCPECRLKHARLAVEAEMEEGK